MSEAVEYSVDIQKPQIESSIPADISFYKELPVKPKYDSEWLVYHKEIKSSGGLFSRWDHIMVRHGRGLAETFNTEDEGEILTNIVSCVDTASDSYRDEKTQNLVYYQEELNLVVVVKDIKKKENEPPPPAYIVTAFTLDDGKSGFENRKTRRAIH